jgi:osmotically inducible protein OsmC
MKRRADVVWTGNLREGEGKLAVASGAFPDQRVTFSARTEHPDGLTSPEELIAAAHAVCYSMALSNALAQAGHTPEQLDVTAVCALDRAEGALTITEMELSVAGTVAGLEEARFRQIAAEAERRCPVSNALRGNVEIRLEAKLA